KRAGERMNRMIHDLLDAARVESGALPIQPEVVNVQDLLDGVAEIMAPLAEEKSLTLHLPPARSLPRLWADSDRVFQVFSNLIGNAIKFTPEGGSITVRAEGSGGRVRFAVVDTGPGIPEDQLASIFERMWQARTDDSRGIGLGLAIARAIVDAHGERIGVESELGVGTEFWFTLRLAEPHDQSTNQDSSARSSVA
ncbi:MAG: HAMP domain-containing sensor histidine kinase, partial [Gemmatimonadota bacterium]